MSIIVLVGMDYSSGIANLKFERSSSSVRRGGRLVCGSGYRNGSVLGPTGTVLFERCAWLFGLQGWAAGSRLEADWLVGGLDGRELFGLRLRCAC